MMLLLLSGSKAIKVPGYNWSPGYYWSTLDFGSVRVQRYVNDVCTPVGTVDYSTSLLAPEKNGVVHYHDRLVPFVG